jgi:hypothetical protein
VSLDGQQRAHRLSVRRLEPIPASTQQENTTMTRSEAITNGAIRDTILQNRALCVWLASMPPAPGKHDNDAFLETAYNTMEASYEGEPTFASAVGDELAKNADITDETALDMLDYGFWDAVAARLSISLPPVRGALKCAVHDALNEMRALVGEMDDLLDVETQDEAFEDMARQQLRDLADEAFEEWTEEQRKGR